MQVGDLVSGRLSLGGRIGIVLKLRKRHARVLWRNGKQVDPYKQNDLPEGEPVLNNHWNAFNYIKEKYYKKIEG